MIPLALVTNKSRENDDDDAANYIKNSNTDF